MPIHFYRKRNTRRNAFCPTTDPVFPYPEATPPTLPFPIQMLQWRPSKLNHLTRRSRKNLKRFTPNLSHSTINNKVNTSREVVEGSTNSNNKNNNSNSDFHNNNVSHNSNNIMGSSSREVFNDQQLRNQLFIAPPPCLNLIFIKKYLCYYLLFLFI